MTCIEKLRIEYPELIRLADDLLNRSVGYFGCPHMFKYAPRPINCDPRILCITKCSDCWNRELSEWKEKDYDL